MGTRGAWGVRKGGTDYIWYNHFDSYAEGLGEDIVTYLNNTKLDELKAACESITMLNTNEKPTPEQIARCIKVGTIDLRVGSQSENDWYCLLRKAQGDVGKTLELGYCPDDKDFLADSLFCEYAYIINLDDGIFEIYRGFNKDPGAAGRYACKVDKPQAEYTGVKLVGSLPLASPIPDTWIEDVFGREDDEEDAA